MCKLGLYCLLHICCKSKILFFMVPWYFTTQVMNSNGYVSVLWQLLRNHSDSIKDQRYLYQSKWAKCRSVSVNFELGIYFVSREQEGKRAQKWWMERKCKFHVCFWSSLPSSFSYPFSLFTASSLVACVISEVGKPIFLCNMGSTCDIESSLSVILVPLCACGRDCQQVFFLICFSGTLQSSPDVLCVSFYFLLFLSIYLISTLWFLSFKITGYGSFSSDFVIRQHFGEKNTVLKFYF